MFITRRPLPEKRWGLPFFSLADLGHFQADAQPPDDADGGGGDPAAGDSGGDDTSELERLRQETAALRATETQMKHQLEALKGAVSPQEYAAAQAAAEQARKDAEAKDQQLKNERERLSRKHATELQAAKTKEQDALALVVQKTTEFLAKEVFHAVGGDPSADSDGTSSFQAFMSLKGRRHLRVKTLADGTDQLYVVDAAGDELLDEAGKPLSPKDWMTKVAKESAVVGRLFRPLEAAGGNTRSSLSGMRHQRGQDLSKLTHAQLLEVAWPDQ